MQDFLVLNKTRATFRICNADRNSQIVLCLQETTTGTQSKEVQLAVMNILEEQEDLDEDEEMEDEQQVQYTYTI